MGSSMKPILRIAALIALAACAGGAARAQQITAASVKRDVGWDQKLNAEVPLDAVFRDETGKDVTLGAFFGKKPVVMMMPFYRCPGICMLELDVMTKSFMDSAFGFQPGKEFQTVIVSINPKEGADVAAAKKEDYLNQYGHPETAGGWHFLTGTQPQIQRLAHAIGYRYDYDLKTDQYAHPAGLVVLTPTGRVSKYFLFKNAMFPPHDLHLALVEASGERIGSPVDKFVLLCCNYDPTTGRYGLAIMKVTQLFGGLTVLCLGGFMLISLRKERRPA